MQYLILISMADRDCLLRCQTHKLSVFETWTSVNDYNRDQTAFSVIIKY